MVKNLVVYFSRKGKNYVSGGIVDLEIGNSAVIAQKIQKKINADIFEIETAKTYPDDYYETTEVAKAELQENFRPELKSKIDDISSYDNIILCYPNWWGTFPTAVMTFLESYDFSGKTIYPICTHEGSRMGHSESDLRRMLRDSDVAEGLPIHGSYVNTADALVDSWLDKNNLL